MLLVFIEMPLGQGQMNSALSVDFMFFNKLLIWKTWLLASSMMVLAILVDTGTMVCFQEGPLVVD